jgi:hypothetical protein
VEQDVAKLHHFDYTTSANKMHFVAHGLSNELSILIDYWRECLHATDLECTDITNQEVA